MGCALSGTSLWLDQAPPRDQAPLPGDLEVDVAIVGGGFTGLWTALHLARESDLSVVVLEAEHVGFGASGRNGGWCSALYPSTTTPAQLAAVRDAIDHVERTTHEEGIDCDLVRGGTVVLARNEAQWQRARREAVEYGHALLDAAATDEVLRASRTLGATFTPHCAALHPAKLVHGLAEAVERHGGVIHDGTRVTAIEPHRVRTTHGTVRARHVLRATEGYTAGLPGERRTVAPVHSLVIATEPLPPEVWDEIGLRRRETFSDHRHLIIYGQRTADDRIVFGGRGAPYGYGSRTTTSDGQAERVWAALHATLVDLFPILGDVGITHRWGGALGIARDWNPSVGLDPATGLGWAGGYVGDGVSTSNLAGRTLADLVLGRNTDLVRLPWVGHRSRRWEPEPLRWLGINAGLRAMQAADTEERRTGRPSRIARLMAPLIS